MANQNNLDKAYMKCALAIAELSHANRKKVGAILVSPDGHIIAEGFNGTPSGFNNSCEKEEIVCDHVWLEVNTVDKPCRVILCNKCKIELTHQEFYSDRFYTGPATKLVTKPEVLHAESNAISKVACSTNSSKDATLYVTLSPCFDCAKLIIQAKIKRVVYYETYKTDDGQSKLEGIALLIKANIQCEEIDYD